MTFVIILGILGLVFIGLCMGSILVLDPVVTILAIAGIYGLVRKFIVKD